MRKLLLAAVAALTMSVTSLAVYVTDSDAAGWTIAPAMCGIDGYTSDLDGVGMTYGRVNNYSTSSSAKIQCGLGAAYYPGGSTSTTEDLAWVDISYVDNHSSANISMNLASFDPLQLQLLDLLHGPIQQWGGPGRRDVGGRLVARLHAAVLHARGVRDAPSVRHRGVAPGQPLRRGSLMRDVLVTAAVAAVVGGLAGFAMRDRRGGDGDEPVARAAGAAPGLDPGLHLRDETAGVAPLAPASRARWLPESGSASEPANDEEPPHATPPPPPPTPEEMRAMRNRVIVAPYEAESRNAAWAASFEAELRGAFEAWTGERDVDGLSLDAVECRTSRCRVLLRYEDAALLDPTMEALVTRSLFDNACAIDSMGIEETGLAPVHTLYFQCGGRG